MKIIIVMLSVTVLVSGCFKNYFKVNTDPTWSVDKLKDAGAATNKTVIVHFAEEILRMSNPVIESGSISGKLYTYRPTHQYSDPNPKDQTHPYKHRQRDALFSELHLYVKDEYSGQKEITINEKNFKEMRFYSKNRGATTGSYIAGALLLLSGVAAGSFLALLIACNCPQVYLETSPNNYEFLAGMYSGAIMSNLERTDLLLLTGFTPISDTIRIKISGLPGETQFLNNASMKKLVHPIGTEVVGNRYGDLFIIDHLETPKKVMAGEILDRSKSVSYRDGNGYGFHITDSTAALSSLILQYERKQGEKKALLVSRLKNTNWGGYLFKEFKGLYGSAYSAWVNQQEKSGSIQMMEWQKQQGLLLKVSILTENGWDYVDYFPPAGNTASRDMAMEIDISRAKGNNITIKLESAFRFWEVDQAVISYDAVKMGAAEEVKLITATKNGQDQSSMIEGKDQGYVTLDKTDQLKLEFVDPGASAEKSGKPTYVFIAGGYYHQDPVNNQPAQGTELAKFLAPGQFHKYSVSKYAALGLQP